MAYNSPELLTQPAASLLDPRVLAKLASLELVARQVMDGQLQGVHRSHHVGFALDFAQHRPYAPGDDIKRIDWRAFARNERYYIKQHEVSTNLRAHLLLDSSGSMAYRGATDAVSKFRYGQFLAACLAYLVLNQHDSAGLITFDARVHDVLPPRSAPSHLARLLTVLEQAEPRGESSVAAALHDVAGRIRGRRALVVLISDLFDDAAALADALHRLRHDGHEVVLLHVMAKDELEFPFRTWSRFESLERPDERQRLDPAVVRATYLANLSAHLRAIEDAARRLRIRHVLVDTTRPLDDALHAYLAARHR